MNTNGSNHDRRALTTAFLWGALIVGAAGLGAACTKTSSGKSQPPMKLTGTVSGTSGVAVVGATVYLVPTTAVSTAPITSAGVLAGTTKTFDEPLEDAVKNAGGGFPQGVTDATGAYWIGPIPDGKYFVYTQPAFADKEHLRGGNLCRQSADAKTLRASNVDIVLSSSPPAAANFVGMSSCLVCHPQYATEETLAHRLGFRVPGVSSGLQDISEHPDIDDGLAYFLSAATYMGGTPVYMYDYDSTRGFDKFETSLSDPTGGGGVVYAKLWLWRDSGTGEYKITIENVGNAGDPNNLAERVVALTYGGAVNKQRYMITWPGLNALYPLLQYQQEGSDNRYERTRRVFRDYHLDFYWDDNASPANPADDLIVAPAKTNNVEQNCMGCHATNYRQYTDVTGEIRATTLEDPMAEYDLDGNGFINDLNTGCESCHGPGSMHVTAKAARYIITPQNLSPSRANQLCGRCHDRQEGKHPDAGEQPINLAGEFAPPGISRSEFLVGYVDPSGMGPLASAYWPDFVHAKSHHQQYEDLLKSVHYRNDNHLVVCGDCHNMHGGTGFERGLVADPDAPETPLCMICHGDDISSTAEHTQAMLGQPHGAAVASCVDCHMVKTGKSGAGHYGFLLSAPTGTAADSTEIYFENDTTSHVFDVPRKTNLGVEGVIPEQAMPIPYTQACGTCHDPSQLQNL